MLTEQLPVATPAHTAAPKGGHRKVGFSFFTSCRSLRQCHGPQAKASQRGLIAAFVLVTLSPCAARSDLSTDAIAYGEELGPGVARFYVNAAERSLAQPSYALVDPAPKNPPALHDFPVRPVFSIRDGFETVNIVVDANTSLYGTGMVVGPLLRNGHKVQTWNLDAYAYGAHNHNLYQSHPWVLAVRADGTAFGVLADSTHRCILDTTTRIAFTCPAPFPVVVINRASPMAVVEELASLTGYMPLPPKWALGYQQNRYSYSSAAKVLDIAKQFRLNRMPCDAIWMDIDYMDHFRGFSFDRATFPDPKGLNQTLRHMGFHNVWIIDPAVKVEASRGVTAIYDSGNAQNVWVKSVLGIPYIGKVWPGEAVFPDFLNPKVRQWWSGFYPPFVAQGVEGVWNDMNEPAVFTLTKTMPLSNKHAGDATLRDDVGHPQGVALAVGSHERYHNVYGMMMARATRDGLLLADPNHRPFVLSRANYIGGQRYAASWTGDNTASWEHLGYVIPMVLNMGLSGQPFVGADIGGYRYDQEMFPKGLKPTRQEDGRLFARWMGVGALLPFSRGNYEKGYPWDREPWKFGDPVTTTDRLALQRRYRLMPYLYTLFEEASRTGLPVARPLFFADPRDLRLRAISSSFLLGQDVLVAAQLDPKVTQAAHLPSGIWEPFGFGRSDDKPNYSDTTDTDLPGLFIRGGAIVPTGPVMQHVDARPLDPLTLLICLDALGAAHGTLYEDKGDGFDYLAGRPGGSRYSRTTLDAKQFGNHVEVQVTQVDGRMHLPVRQVRVRLFFKGKEYNAAGSSSEPIYVYLEDRRTH